MYFVFSFCTGGRKEHKDQRHHERQLYNRACGFLVSDLGELPLICYFKILASILGIAGASLPGGCPVRGYSLNYMGYIDTQGCREVAAASKSCCLRKRWSLAVFWQVGHSVKDNKWFLGCTHTIIQYLNHSELSTCKWKVWNKFPTTPTIGTTATS